MLSFGRFFSAESVRSSSAVKFVGSMVLNLEILALSDPGKPDPVTSQTTGFEFAVATVTLSCTVLVADLMGWKVTVISVGLLLETTPDVGVTSNSSFSPSFSTLNSKSSGTLHCSLSFFFLHSERSHLPKSILLGKFTSFSVG